MLQKGNKKAGIQRTAAVSAISLSACCRCRFLLKHFACGVYQEGLKTSDSHSYQLSRSVVSFWQVFVWCTHTAIRWAKFGHIMHMTEYVMYIMDLSDFFFLYLGLFFVFFSVALIKFAVKLPLVALEAGQFKHLLILLGDLVSHTLNCSRWC